MMGLFMISGLVIALLGFGMIGYFGWKVKSNENLILFQSLPLTFYYVLAWSLYELGERWFPTPEDSVNSAAANLTFSVHFPALVIAVGVLTSLGVRGLQKQKETPDRFLMLTSLVAATAIGTLVFTHFLYPVLFVVILVRKVLRK